MAYDSEADTRKHMDRVQSLVLEFVKRIKYAVWDHDKSKLESPEKETFDEYTPKLKGSTYGSDEYKEFLKGMDVALKHHYANNRHHPEHFDNGINDMTLIDLLEMLCDWKAATERHADGSITKSLEINKGRFGISDQLFKILENTCKLF